MVLNLILNAVEAMDSVEAKPRDLLISTEQDQTVRDSGPDIDPSHLERVFDAFHTTKSSGMGMGLSIYRSIIGAIEAGCGQRRMNLTAPNFSSRCPPSRRSRTTSAVIAKRSNLASCRPDSAVLSSLIGAFGFSVCC
jgi:hypothetical protein